MTNKLSYRFSAMNNYPKEYEEKELEGYDRQLAYEVFKAVSDGKFHSVRLHRDTRVNDYETEHRATMEIGDVKVVQYKPIYPKRLGFRARVKVLFTGDVPFTIGQE